VGALVVVLVPAHHQVDAVPVEQRYPLLADTPVGAVELVGGGDDHLVHDHDHPVDVAVLPGRPQLPFQPALLRATGVPAHVGVAAVLVAHVVVVQADHAYRAGGERVPQPAGLRVAVVGRHGEVGL